MARDLKVGQFVTFNNRNRVIVRFDVEKQLVWLATIPEYCSKDEWRRALDRSPVSFDEVTP